jgi:hypothetical protein
MALRRYGEWGGRACDDDSDRPCASIVGGRVAAGIATAATYGSLYVEQHDRVNAVQGQAIPCRLPAMKSRPVVGT